jgi:hypothetical protein
MDTKLSEVEASSYTASLQNCTAEARVTYVSTVQDRKIARHIRITRRS